jgi:nucleotide-binding universal stress UspA family protein
MAQAVSAIHMPHSTPSASVDGVGRAADPGYRTILVPLDGSHFAEGAMPTATALAARFGATVHTVTVAVSDFELRRIQVEAARSLGTGPDDPRIHVEVDTDVAGAVQRRASELDSCLVCLSTQGRDRLAGSVLGSTARDIIERGHRAVVVAGPVVVHPDPGRPVIRPLGVDRLVACVDGTPASEGGLPVAAAWAHALGMAFTIVTVAEPAPPPVRIGAPWRRHHGPHEDADAYMRHLGDRWAFAAPGLETSVVYDPISPADGMRDFLATHPAGLIVVTSHLRSGFPRLAVGSTAARIIRSSTAPALVVPAQPVEG